MIDEKAFEVMLKRAEVKQENVGIARKFIADYEEAKHSGTPHRIDYGLGSTFYCHTCKTANHCEQQSKHSETK